MARQETKSQNSKPRMTDDSLRVRQLTHYQFSWTARESGESGIWTLQLVLDEGAWEEVLTISPEDADALQDVLENTSNVFYDIDRRVLMFGVTKAGD
ncbi:hypothetical protein G1H11_17165 [Phytoactinopolyspora alkaliphila]|uniref:Uncharacterized protein n=2 Tax=Phytoactinopolyspora alkaliphila TaxID=1783498 RepID=A0A6N9YPR1_9ACTN|nr:hypothetical protein [Phytoactinopolyspora alkaliphila]